MSDIRRRWRNRVRTVVFTGMLALATVPAAAQPQRGALPPSPPVHSGGYTLDAEVKPRRVQPNAEVTVQAEVTASQAAQNQRVDVEIKDAQNRMVAQQIYSGQSFTPGQTRTYQWRWRAPADLPPGDYTVKVGIFSADWQQLIAWDNMAALFRVGADRGGSPSVQSGGYTLDAQARPRQVKPGDELRIETIVKADQAAQNQRVDVEIYDVQNRRVAQHIYSGQNFAAGQTQRYEWRWRVPAELTAGAYTVKVGIFSADWRQLVAWDNLAGTFKVDATTNLAKITSPAAGSSLPGPTVTFNWTPGAGVSEYRLVIGTAPGTHNLYLAAENSLSRTVTGLPTDGRPVYVRLWSKTGETWQFIDHTYTAATVSGAR